MMAKNIVLCFDGTCNEPQDAEQKTPWYKFGEPEDNSVTNIFKLHLLFGGDLADGHYFSDQISLYYPGVGTYGNKVKQVFNAALAPEGKDVGKIIRDGMKDLKALHKAGDRVFIFGFSRGAAIARRFAAVLPEFFTGSKLPKVRFLGVFDTVAAMGVPNLVSNEKPVSDVVFENQTIASAIKEALHLVSLDERRKAFQPTLMNQEDRVTEIWFPGVHADVGGGFRYDGLSDNTLQFMLDEITRRNLGLKVVPPALIDYASLVDDDVEIDIDYDDIIIQPNPLGKLHRQERSYVLSRVTLADRELRVNQQDRRCDTRPLLHHSATERIHKDQDYRPAVLRRRPHIIWKSTHEQEEYHGLKNHLLLGMSPLKELQVGESKTIVIYANRKFNRSGLLLLTGASYVFKVRANQVWYDSGIRTTPKGWNRKTQELGLKEIFIQLQEGKRRCPDADWFELVGGIGTDDSELFRILRHTKASSPYTPEQSGEFYAFANDLDRFYSNNLGSVEVTIKRTE